MSAPTPAFETADTSRCSEAHISADIFSRRACLAEADTSSHTVCSRSSSSRRAAPPVARAAAGSRCSVRRNASIAARDDQRRRQSVGQASKTNPEPNGMVCESGLSRCAAQPGAPRRPARRLSSGKRAKLSRSAASCSRACSTPLAASSSESSSAPSRATASRSTPTGEPNAGAAVDEPPAVDETPAGAAVDEPPAVDETPAGAGSMRASSSSIACRLAAALASSGRCRRSDRSMHVRSSSHALELWRAVSSAAVP